MNAGARMQQRHGFSLVEVLVALTIGSLIAYVAMVGFRSTMQSIGIANRLGTENRMLRAGFFTALEDLDFWTSFDPLDPAAAPSSAPLRADGHPFAPMQPVSGAPVFSANHLVWQRASFYAGNLASLLDEHGNYALVGWAAGAGTAAPDWNPYNDHHLRSAWLVQHAGFYAWMDYLPVNSALYYYQNPQHNGLYDAPFHHRRWEGGAALYDFQHPRFANPGWADRSRFTAQEADFLVPASLRQLSGAPDEPSFGILSEPDWLRPPFRDRLADWGIFHAVTPVTGHGAGAAHPHNHWFAAGGSTPGGVDAAQPFHRAQYHRFATPPTDLLGSARPAVWPELDYTITRSMDPQRRTAVALRLSHPTTGSSTGLGFSAIGTTLRGARMQRGLDDY